MRPFKLILKLSTPVVLPQAPPTLDALLQEAMCRLHSDWDRQHELPLNFHKALGVYQASQVIFATTSDRPMVAQVLHRCSAPDRMDRAQVSDPPDKIAEGGGGFAKPISHFPAHLAPYLLFYGVGDAAACLDLIVLLDGIGREHSAHSGSFEVFSAAAVDDARQWSKRPLPLTASGLDLPFDPIKGLRRLRPGQGNTICLHPPRILREQI